MMNDTRRAIDEGLAEMTSSSDYPNLVEIKANDDYTNFTVVTKEESVGLDDSIAVLGLYMYGGMYGIFNGERADNIHIDFVSEVTGQVYESADSKDMGE